MIWLVSGCLTVDSFGLFTKRCTAQRSPGDLRKSRGTLDKVCIPCDEDYSRDAEFSWRDMTIAEYEGITVSDILEGGELRITDSSVVSRVPFTSEDEEATLDAYFLASNGRFPERAATTIVYNHGNYAGVEHYLPRVVMLHALGYNVYFGTIAAMEKSMLVGSEEKSPLPTLIQWMSDARLAYDEALAVAPDPSKMIVYGKSLGGWPAGEQAAVGQGVCAQIFESAAVSIREQVETNLSIYLPGSYITSGVLENELKLADTTNPTLIMGAPWMTNGVPRPSRPCLMQSRRALLKACLCRGAYHDVDDGGIPDSDLFILRSCCKGS